MDPISAPVAVAAFAALALPLVRRFPFVLAVAILNVATFLYAVAAWVLLDSNALYGDLAMRPEDAFGSGAYTLVTHMFMHGSLLHILGNTVFLVFFGMPLEGRIGPRRVAAIYFASGIAASVIDSLVSIAVTGDSHVPRIGASGAIFGIMGAFLALYPVQRILMPLVVIIMEAPVWVGVVIYGGFETYLVLINQSDGIGHVAHVGGLIAGMVAGPAVAGDIAVPKAIVPGALKPIARGGRARELADRIEKEDIHDIREAWLDELIEVARCPECGSGLRKAGDRIACVKCGFSVRYLEKARKGRPPR
ncbi:MAG: rhomboid family intramembrane serine protease [Thermoplasmata archaeon]|nr:rhomboid family intramembrane serine protease [Thermoplasmata archaeon]